MQQGIEPNPKNRRRGDDSVPVASGPVDHLITCSLVLDSVGIPNRIPPGRSALTVPGERAEEAMFHLDRYFEENAGWPERPEPAPQHQGSGSQPTFFLMGCLALFFLVTGPWNEQTAWFANGAIDSGAIRSQGEWWRLVTALTLHADMLHLLGNCIIGGFMVHLLTGQLGAGTGWLLLVLCGASGNFLNIAARETVHHSVGFSTSVFAAIGMFSGMRMGTGRKISSILLPLGAGAGLLAMLGVEGERTDLGAHFFGFICGLVLGTAARLFSLPRLAGLAWLQRSLLLATGTILAGCWLLAMK
jgi:membrane associated rhomboid family serine protease